MGRQLTIAADASARVDALLKVGLRLASTARSGRVLLARIEDAIELDWIPQPWGEQISAELARARIASREPAPWRIVERILRDAWGGRATDELDELEREPAVVTPGAQVHRGMLEGAPVAVKVMTPGLAGLVRQDLLLLEGLVAPLAAAFPALDVAGVLEEVRERVLEELDLEHEAVMQRRFWLALRRHPFLSVPAPITRLCAENVLVSEWIEGVPLLDAPNPDQAARRLVLFGFGAMRAGLVHADPIPDDVLVLEDGGLAILDFGATRVAAPRRVELLADALDGFVAGDPEQFGLALTELGHAPRELGATALRVARNALGELGGIEPSRLDSAALVAAGARLLDDPHQASELIAQGTLPPEDLWPARAIAQLFATIARMGAEGPWLELARDALRRGWECEMD